MRWIVLLSLFGCLAVRADVTGQWNGSARMTKDGTSKQVPIRMTLVQHGDDVSGTVFVEDKDWKISEGGSEEGRRVHFRIDVPNDVVHFDLSIAGDHMTGKATAAKGSSEPVVEVDLIRKVQARPATDISGAWSGTMSGKGETVPLTIEFRQSGNQVGGVAKAKDKELRLRGEMDGAKLTFQVEAGTERVRFALIVTPKSISGFAAVQGHSNETVLDVELTPKP
jgi:hypothetical protein